MASMNRVTLLGNLGRDPEVRNTTEGTTVANLSLATTRRWKDGDEVKEATDWHRIVAFGRTAEVLGEYAKKGSQLLIEGRLQTRAYLDKDDQKRHVTEIVASRVQLLGRPEDKPAPEGGDERPAAAEPPSPEPADDDIPF